MTPSQRTLTTCCLIFSITVATIVSIASALIFMKP